MIVIDVRAQQFRMLQKFMLKTLIFDSNSTLQFLRLVKYSFVGWLVEQKTCFHIIND